MGNQASHKHLRADSFKSNQPHSTGHAMGPGGYTGGGGGGAHANYGNIATAGFVYPSEDFADEFDDTMTTSSKNSYSPSESVPTFRFPSRSDSINMNRNEIKKIPVVFKYESKIAKDVQLVGTFTNWKDKIQMIKSDGDFIVIVDLPEGDHQYKFVVDGKWEFDPTQPTIDDTFSGKNNIVIVKKSDFEVMDALAMDSIQQQTQKHNNTTQQSSNNDDLSRSPTGEYTDEIPLRGLNSMTIDKPPFLPPQLLNIVLNKDTLASCEPALLPEPNHVMLKHLYALSIRDGVMVLSSTFRYKQKFVTTCFYKPI